MQGLAGLGYEVVDMPMLNNERGVASMKNAADMLADFGRNGDTYVVHAAEGETVVPLEVLDANPRLKNMLFSQMQDMGIEPERYIVGNELNSINPVTGQPEFFIKKIFKALKKTVKRVGKVLKKIAPIVLPIVAPFMLPMMPVAFATGLGSLAGGLISGQSLSEALKGAVISGGLAGVSNMAFRGGDFLGSMKAPTAGLPSAGDAFTFANPFDTAKTVFSAPTAEQLSGLGVTPETYASLPVADQARLINSLDIMASTPAATTVAPNTATVVPDATTVAPNAVVPDTTAFVPNVSSAVPTPDQLASLGITPETFASLPQADQLRVAQSLQTMASAPVAPVASGSEGYFTNLKKAFTPGDDYGFGDFYADSLSPSRASIQPDIGKITAEETAKAQAELLAQGVDPSSVAGQAAIKATVDTAVKNAGPGILAKFGPLAGTAVGAGITSDALLGTNIFSAEEVGPPGLVSRETGFDYLRKDPERFGFDTAEFFGDNPYYSRFAQTDDQDDVDVTGLAGLTDAAAPFTAANFVNQYLGPQSRSVLPIAAKEGGEIVGPGTGTSDSIPALLSDGEFVITAKAVENAGGGDRKKGAQRMYDFMRNLENGAA